MLLKIPVVLIMLFSSCSALRQANSVSSKASPNSLIRKIEELRKKFNVPGASIAIVDHSKTTTTWQFGMANIEKQIPVQDHISICEKEVTRATPEETQYFKEILFSTTDSHGVTHTPAIAIRLYVDKLLDVGVEAIKIVEFQNKLIILASLKRTIKFFGEPCITNPALLFLPASYQKNNFCVLDIDDDNTLYEIIRKGFNNEYNRMPLIIKSSSSYRQWHTIIQEIPSKFDHIDEAFKDKNNSAQQ